MAHRAQEGDDRDILGMVVGDWPHHAVVPLEAGDKVTDEVKLGAGDEHRSQRPKGRLDVGGCVGVVERMQHRARLGAVADLDLFGLMIVGEDVSLLEMFTHSMLAGLPAKRRIRIESGSPRQMISPSSARATPFTLPAW